jgi:hypothetical protein
MVISFATHLALLLAGDAAGPVVRIAQALAERLRGRGAAGSTRPAVRFASIVVASPSGLLKQRLAGRVAGAGVIHAAAEREQVVERQGEIAGGNKHGAPKRAAIVRRPTPLTSASSTWLRNSL